MINRLLTFGTLAVTIIATAALAQAVPCDSSIFPEILACGGSLISFQLTDDITADTKTPLQRAYEACERHIVPLCPAGIGICNTVCAWRPGTSESACLGSYEWPECNEIAERWLASPDRQTLLDLKAQAVKERDDRDRELVRRIVEGK